MNDRQKEFSDLISPHLSSLYSTALRMTRNRHDAEDLLQDTVYKAYRALDQYRINTNFKAWVFRILVNTFITARRKEKNLPQRISYDEFEEFFLYNRLNEMIMMPTVAAEDFIEKMFDDDVKQALEKLPKQFRLVVLLSDVNEFSYKEIADMMQIPLGTVMSRLFRGRKLLQRQLWHYAKKRLFTSDKVERTDVVQV
jgi:RNA polymerase sigma-70 factor (ECF subfamily)